MAKILAFGDVHLGHYRMPIEPYILRSMRAITDAVESCRPDVVLFAGDAFRTRTPSAEHMYRFGRMLERISGYCPVFMISGNHDLLVSGVATIDVYDTIKWVKVFEAPQVCRWNDIQIVAVPWISGKAKYGDINATPNMQAIAYVLLDVLHMQTESSKPKILLAHCSTLEGRLDGGQMSTLTDDILWPRSEFERFDLSILGHYHNPQETYPGVYYTGSICPLSFGEMGHEKSVLLYDTSDKSVTRIPLPTPRFHRVECNHDTSLAEMEFEPDTFLQFVSDRDISVSHVPDSVVWYEVVIRKPPMERTTRLDIPLDEITPQAAIEAYLERAGYEDEVTDVLKLATELMEE